MNEDQPPFEIPRPVVLPPKPPEVLTDTKIDFALTIYWTKITQTWDEARCRLMLERVQALSTSAEFEGNFFERKFKVEGLDELAHAGASLLALQKVLQARLN